MITTRSSYDACVKEIDAAVQEFMLDQAGSDLSEDEVWTDMAAALLIEAQEEVAREVCRCQLGYVPQELERFWRGQKEYRKVQQQESAKRKAEERKAAKAAKEEADRRAQEQAVRASRCPKCFTLPAANGSCMC